METTLAESRQTGSFVSMTSFGEHPLTKESSEIIQRVAVTDATVLITGESGTGKELAARAIHHLGPRADPPFVPVNCATIPETLLESELFGYARGAFSRAVASRAGMFQLAHGCTLFLDEIGEIPLSLQAKLLRVLQYGEVRPIGANQTVAINVRLIAAANNFLVHQVEKGSFREDLFFRLRVIPLHLPPLRAAAMDLGVSEFVAKPVNNRDLLNRVRTQLRSLEWDNATEQSFSKIEQSSPEPKNRK